MSREWTRVGVVAASKSVVGEQGAAGAVARLRWQEVNLVSYPKLTSQCDVDLTESLCANNEFRAWYSDLSDSR